MNDKLFSVKGRVFQEMSILFIKYKVNDRIESINNLSKKYDVARGTIQTILKELEDKKDIKLEKKGRLGTFLIYKNNLSLLKNINKTNFYGVLPLPYTLRYESLAMGIKLSLREQLSSNVHLSFVKQSSSRISLLNDKMVDFCVLSKFHALNIVKTNKNLKIILTLDNYSYISNHVIVSNTSEIKVVGIDANSLVHSMLVEKHFSNVTYKQIDYNKLSQSLKKGLIDATVLNDDEDTSYFKSVEKIETDLDITRACILVNKDNFLFKNILDLKTLKIKIEKIQSLVLNEEIDPTY